jgi:hypothetical protein
MGTIIIKKQSAASVALPASDQLSMFVDSSDDILKTKDSAGVVRPSGVGSADELATAGAPIDVSASPPPTVGQALVATTPTSAVWTTIPILLPTPIKAGPTTYTAALGEFVRVSVTGGLVTVNLPATHPSGTQIGVKLVTTAANNCVVVASGAETIDGVSTLTLTTNYKAVVLMSDGTNWMQVS